MTQQEWVQTVMLDGLAFAISGAVLWLVLRGAMGASKLASTYFDSEGVVTKWFQEDATSRTVMASAMDQMPVMMKQLDDRGKVHHEQMVQVIHDLMDVHKHQMQETSSWRRRASALDSPFSTHYTNLGLKTLVHAAKAYVEGGDQKQALEKLEEAEKYLEEGLRHGLQDKA